MTTKGADFGHVELNIQVKINKQLVWGPGNKERDTH